MQTFPDPNAPSVLDPQLEVLPGMVRPASSAPPVDEVSRFEAEGGKPAQTASERKQRVRAERKLRFERYVEQVKSAAHNTQDGCERLLCAVRAKPVQSSALALGLGWLIGRYWPRR
jgi:hypothetical protein